MKLPFKVHFEMQPTIVKNKEKIMSDNDTTQVLDANEVIDQSKSTLKDVVLDHPAYLALAGLGIFAIGYQLGRNQGVNSLLKFAMSN
jgi:hypothetical protein|nr:MAG TPA: hypothetical protein [Bacteriophage sp.]